eukprot:scaffold68913_cov38-Prasinocladus_malaysianus.AAC.1
MLGMQLLELLQSPDAGPRLGAFRPVLEGTMALALRPRIHSPLDPMPLHQFGGKLPSQGSISRGASSRSRSNAGHWEGVRWLWQQQPSASGFVGRGDGPRLGRALQWIRHCRVRATLWSQLRDAAEVSKAPLGVQLEWVQTSQR